MLTADGVRLMARYASWQNAALIAAADGLDDAARRQDRGAFFGSIFATLNHLLWGDRIWMSRLAGSARPNRASIAESVGEEADWTAYTVARAERDRLTLDWASGLGDGALAGTHSWYSGAVGREVTRPTGLLVLHMFNHGTHHRGQVHAMLTAAGARTEATDLFVMPDPS